MNASISKRAVVKKLLPLAALEAVAVIGCIAAYVITGSELWILALVAVLAVFAPLFVLTLFRAAGRSNDSQD